ncbi:MAG: DNA-deoxyinosine glycosylase [Methylobacter sp.]|nr:DNA-deoxyinosine glycosylase [Methylobacter sp.]MDP2099314.1 DNA-deoxyinosine glycosylase [Methylobacter sp.]MDP2428484.1 DNA-deoxyinosine glycosylase [Methylobacter sp.]MDP3055175.1 DNA-deoxyinosine glycosylase [Methylobacter sp.]MDP3363675.1 DNA-deoxyinosine glycosylase [Methylobacter sp.]
MAKPLLFCFEPVADSDAEILILGSMPGQASLAAAHYYANRRNVFWKIIAQLLDFDPDAAYEMRLQALKAAGIALWDVLQSCTRTGSLDARIDAASVTVNDFQDFFRRHGQIRTVCFNGATAEAMYRRHVLPGVSALPIDYLRLPSTSPAHATLCYEQKRQAWQAALTRSG